MASGADDDAERLVRRAYEAFNARDLDAATALMDPDVDWPNAWEGGRVHGPDAVREYWTRQWAAIDPRAEPVRVERADDGRTVVTVHQVVRDLDGAIVDEATVLHSYEIRDGRIVRMDVAESS